MSAGELEYALAKQVPDMARGFTIETSYGRIVIEADDAPKIIKVVRAALQRELDEAKMAKARYQPPEAGRNTAQVRVMGTTSAQTSIRQRQRNSKLPGSRGCRYD